MSWAGLVIAAYLIGSIPMGLIFGKLFWKKDLRQYGSHNIGATNAWRVIGRKAGLLIFIFDFLKGQLGVLLGACMFASPGAMVLGGLFAMLGHMFPIFIGFKGGKGVATALGVIAALMPKVTVIVFIIWLVLTLLTRYVSVASIVAAVLTPILAAAFKEPIIYFLFALVAAVVIVFRHRENIQRLKAGHENKF
ncbi:MAG: glycerol-3-phosphate 1-O-acyltransferase PlsY [Selenomonadaceae bacterium]|nr:glycerol-3-phosphate 1-O-acyltransferase PlsY [Selenomonadaceae bacterium]MBQ3727374.1 glycerol-3-phosphate 1-O-acyltransferase PlsY [Selenomonadaceae bacterium]MBQ9497470.1 glycerol-3-phosphate 1-O-acyltransferase PlsY [Selenomonadaceae bacterium]